MNDECACRACGGVEFCAPLNAYDIYRAESGKLCFQRSEVIEEQLKFYCRECGEEFTGFSAG